MGHLSNGADDTSCFKNEPQNIIQDKKKKKYKCTYPNCDAVFLRPNRLERHIRIHTGERPYRCNFLECTKSYTNSSHLKRHLEAHKDTKKLYKCMYCSLLISSYHNLKRHYKRMHLAGDKITCEICDETFNKRYQFMKHKTIHTGETIYKCEKCPKSYMRLSKLKQHQKIHEKKYPCPVSGCSEIFEKWLLLCHHKKANHVTDYKCNTCDKTFLNKSQLNAHSKIHFETRTVMECPYDKCHKAYFSKSNLDQHVKTRHLGQKFYCDICSVGLTAKSNLIKHIKRHYEPIKKKSSKKTQRKKRKDAGLPKRSAISTLIGVGLSSKVEKLLIERETTIPTSESFDNFSNDSRKIESVEHIINNIT